MSSFDLLPFWRGWALSLCILIPAGIALSVLLSIQLITTHAFNINGIAWLGLFAVLLGVSFFALNAWFTWVVPRSSPLIFIPVLTIAVVATRLAFSRLVEMAGVLAHAPEKVLISVSTRDHLESSESLVDP